MNAFGDTACSTGPIRQALDKAGHRLLFQPATPSAVAAPRMRPDG